MSASLSEADVRERCRDGRLWFVTLRCGSGSAYTVVRVVDGVVWTGRTRYAKFSEDDGRMIRLEPEALRPGYEEFDERGDPAARST